MTVAMAIKPIKHNENKVNLKEKSYPQLQELWERQEKILGNKRFVESLPDKGEKINHFRSQLKEELDKRRNYEKLCKDMSGLDITKDQLDALEWTGKHGPHAKQTSSRPNIDDDDDGDVLKMFVSHSGLCQEKIIIKEKPEQLLIKPSDLIDDVSSVEEKFNAEKSKEFQERVERYAKNLCGRIDTCSPGKPRLLLNKPIKLDKYSTEKVTPMSLKESVTLQLLQENKMKGIQAERMKQRAIPRYTFNTSSYRDPNKFDAFDFMENDDDEDDLSVLDENED